MARDIAWKDLLFLSRYRNHLCILDNEFKLVYNPGLYSSALLSLTIPSNGYCTAIAPINHDLFPFFLGQIYHPPNQPAARLAILSPKNLTSPGSLDVISHLVTKAGERGAFQILAEVEIDQPEAQILYQSGFKDYADQQIWKYPKALVSEIGKGHWIPVSQRDQTRIEEFYQGNIPGSIQRLEQTPTIPQDKVLGCWQKDKIVGLAITSYGPAGLLVDLVFDLNLDGIESLLASLLNQLPYRNRRDVYFRVRSYQERIASALERLGGLPGPQQRAVVKKLAVHYNAKQTFRVQRFKEQPDITTPISNSKIKN